MNSPLTPLSPRLAAGTAKWRNRVPTQIRRLIPIYAVCLCLLLLLLNADVLPSRSRPNVFKRNAAKHKHDRAHEGNVFPKKIWQTWMAGPFAMEQRDSDTAKTWVTKNPGYRYEVLTDDNALSYVIEKYGPDGFDRPDIVEMYRTVDITIIKADLLRYLVMYAEGGVYSDIDVEDLRPIHRFIPERYDESEIDLVISVEIDQPDFKDHPILGKKSQSFCQWTFMAKPRQPVMMRLVENIMDWLNDIAYEQKVAVGDIVLTFDEVISGTGPSAFTAAVLSEMNERSSGKKITWNDFHDLDESKIVSRILVLNVETFAAGQGHSDSGNHNSRGALVKHHYHASNWPSKHTRYSHPVYGEVERCNWNLDCVRTWDENVAAFDKMSPEEQQQKLAEPKPEPMGPGFNGFQAAAPPANPQQPLGDAAAGAAPAKPVPAAA
ncbi:putative Glycosyltransferase family 32 protein [Seiridium cardinale]|uniref:Glycosyltransferase family 32 protein n=1 Tax=Seiridium cardinale TaxID=138064 RepID=A0ABR2Y3B8_9PEZI